MTTTNSKLTIEQMIVLKNNLGKEINAIQEMLASKVDDAGQKLSGVEYLLHRKQLQTELFTKLVEHKKIKDLLFEQRRGDVSALSLLCKAYEMLCNLEDDGILTDEERDVVDEMEDYVRKYNL